MKPTIGHRSGQYNRLPDKKPSAARDYIEVNSHHNITIKEDYLYMDEVKIAININTLEERVKLKRWFMSQLGQNIPLERLLQMLSDSAEKDRHKLQKEFHITV